MQIGLGSSDVGLDLRVLVRVGLLQEARDVGGVRSPDDLLEPSSEACRLGPLAPEAIAEGERLAVLVGDELEHPSRDELVRPCSRLAPNVELAKDHRALVGRHLVQSARPPS